MLLCSMAGKQMLLMMLATLGRSRWRRHCWRSVPRDVPHPIPRRQREGSFGSASTRLDELIATRELYLRRLLHHQAKAF